MNPVCLDMGLRLSARLCKRALRSFVVWAGFVDGEITAVEILAFEGADCRFAFRSAAHGHKSKSARFARHAIGNKVHVRDSSILCEEVLQIRVSGTKRKISNVKFHILVIERMLATKPFPTTGFQITFEKFNRRSSAL